MLNVLDESGQAGYTLIISSCGFADKRVLTRVFTPRSRGQKKMQE
jgi:hypothetical protein